MSTDNGSVRLPPNPIASSQKTGGALPANPLTAHVTGPSLQQQRNQQNLSVVQGIKQRQQQLQAHPVHGTPFGALKVAGNTALDIAVPGHHFISAYEHPIARLEGKGAFKPKPGEIMGGNDFPWLGGPAEGLVGDATEAASSVKAVQGKLVSNPKTLGETVTGALQGAKQTRAAQDVLRSGEKAKRIKEYERISQANPTAAGHREASQALAGKYPTLDWNNFQQFSSETIDQLHKYLVDHPDLSGFDVKRGRDAIDKAYAGTVPTKSEEKVLRKAFGNSATNQIMRATSRFHATKALAYDIGNIPRSVMASGDASGLLRQALLIATGHPGIWAKSVPTYLKAIKSEDFYNAGLAILHNRPNALNGVYDRMGLDLTELTPKGGDMAAREEQFRSPLAEKIPGVRASGRGFMLGLDQARADLADLMYAKAVKAGKGDDEHTLQSIGDVVNSASGRGDLGNGVIGRSSEGLNLLLFSPRLIKSRIDFLNPLWYKGLDPIARHEAYRAMGGLVVLVAAANVIAKAAGANINLDPRSSDFAKIRLGSVRIDLAGGFQQYMHLLGELATQRKMTTTGKLEKLDVQEGPGKTSDWDVVFNFIRSKLAPMSAAAIDVGQRQNSVGQPLTWGNSVVSRVTPLAGQDAYQVGQDAWQSHGPAAGIAAGIGGGLLSAFGGGVQQFTPKQPKVTGTFNPYAPTTGSSGGGYWAGQTGSSGGGYWGK